MSYIPKKLVNPGLYATGDNFLDATTRDVYRGPYHANFNGSLFSGNDPYDPEKRPLVPNPDNTVKPTRVINNPVNRNYEEINDKNSNLLKYGEDPKSFTPKPQIKDYERGSINRYFAKRATEKPPRIIEISAKAYNSILNKDGKYNYAIWRIGKVLWRISGDNEQEVTNTNKQQVENANKEFRGIKSFLRNLIQFYQKREDVRESTGPFGLRRRRRRGRTRIETPTRTPGSTSTPGGARNIPRGDIY